MRTTAGLTFAAALTTADESSTVTGWDDWPGGWPAPPEPAGRFRAPVPSRTRTVPLDASTADSSAAPRMGPSPSGPRRRLVVVAATTGSVGAGVEASPAGGGPAPAGSIQTGFAHSGWASGGGE